MIAGPFSLRLAFGIALNDGVHNDTYTRCPLFLQTSADHFDTVVSVARTHVDVHRAGNHRCVR
jgi:hypothetical protein